MSWIPEERYPYSWWQTLLIKVLRCGKLPGHVAFIMDGNRRFAKQKHLQTVEGHVQGFEKLAQTLQWCHDLGINQVTVYAFSIENYKRPQEEVDTLMNLARDKFRRLINESDRLSEAGVRVKVLGNVTLLPKDLQELVHQAERITAPNSKATLNIAISYTSREEMTQAVRKLSEAAKQGVIDESDISNDLIERCLYTSGSGSGHQMPDLLVRTSGEVRLSDFLLWQSAYSVTHFTNVLWPDFSLHHLLAAIFHFQSKSFYIQQLFDHAKPDDVIGSSSDVISAKDDARKARVAKFLQQLDHDWAANNATATSITANATDGCQTANYLKSRELPVENQLSTKPHTEQQQLH